MYVCMYTLDKCSVGEPAEGSLTQKQKKGKFILFFFFSKLVSLDPIKTWI
jgi:hypothetical protein